MAVLVLDGGSKPALSPIVRGGGQRPASKLVFTFFKILAGRTGGLFQMAAFVHIVGYLQTIDFCRRGHKLPIPTGPCGRGDVLQAALGHTEVLEIIRHSLLFQYPLNNWKNPRRQLHNPDGLGVLVAVDHQLAVQRLAHPIYIHRHLFARKGDLVGQGRRGELVGVIVRLLVAMLLRDRIAYREPDASCEQGGENKNKDQCAFFHLLVCLCVRNKREAVISDGLPFYWFLILSGRREAYLMLGSSNPRCCFLSTAFRTMPRMRAAMPKQASITNGQV